VTLRKEPYWAFIWAMRSARVSRWSALGLIERNGRVKESGMAGCA
jgi:hypothetical protein